MNEELLKLAVKNIEAEPKSWDQTFWVRNALKPSAYSEFGYSEDEWLVHTHEQVDVNICGTTLCLAGHVVNAAGYRMNMSGKIYDTYNQQVYPKRESIGYWQNAIPRFAAELLDITDEQAGLIFQGSCGKNYGSRNGAYHSVSKLKSQLTQILDVHFD